MKEVQIMYYRVNEEVKKALEENRPVVALESTIISHGMPYPQNVETAFSLPSLIALYFLVLTSK